MLAKAILVPSISLVRLDHSFSKRLSSFAAVPLLAANWAAARAAASL